MRTIKTVKTLLLVLFAVGAIMLFVPMGIPSITALSNTRPKDVNTKPPAKPPTNLEDYVGSDSCRDCHANQAAFYSVTAHRKTEKFAAVDERGCEACHGGARKHVEFYKEAAKLYEEGKPAEAEALQNNQERVKAAELKYFKTLSSEEVNASCLKCHEGEQGHGEERFNYRRSQHARHGVSCIDCHSAHSPKHTQFLLKQTEPNVCYTCHAEKKADFSRPFHHKVPEGAMKCSDCHNQHGGFQSKQVRSWVGNDVTCLKCHADKSGPFAFEHAPVKMEGCQACHTPHGSNNPRLLTRNTVRFLCLECHSNTPGIPAEGTGVGPPTPSFHNLALPRFQNCTVCHVMIHGSNTHRVFFR